MGLFCVRATQSRFMVFKQLTRLVAFSINLE
jgi:hypothetical protein